MAELSAFEADEYGSKPYTPAIKGYILPVTMDRELVRLFSAPLKTARTLFDSETIHQTVELTKRLPPV